MAPQRDKYRPEIDGLRTLALLPVMFFHSGLGASGGYVGVDVFFVISGFLIGRIVLHEIESGAFSLINFWERRIRRLLPALTVVIAATLIAGYIWLVPAHFQKLGQSIAAQPLLKANFYFWGNSGYFATESEFLPLLHTWSLAVEEQFYLLFPPIMLLLVRRGRKITRNVVVACILLSLIWSFYGSYRFPTATFFLIPGRVWELDLGVLLLFIPFTGTPSKHWMNEVISWVGMGLILGSVLVYDMNTRFPGLAAVAPCLGAALLIRSNSGGLTLCGKILALRPMVLTGKISYSLYLWHWPLLVFAKYILIRELHPIEGLGILICGWGISWLSWRFIERPFRKPGKPFGRWVIFPAAMAVASGFYFTGKAIDHSNGVPGRFSKEIFDHLPPGYPFPGFHGYKDLPETGELYKIGDRTKAPQLLLWGDSHAECIMPVLDSMGKKRRVAISVASSPGVIPFPATYPLEDSWNPWDFGTPVLKFVRDNHIRHVLLVARWNVYVIGEPDGDLDVLICDKVSRASTPSVARVVFERNLKKTITELNKLGATVWIMKQVPLQPRSVPPTVTQLKSRNLDMNLLARPISEHLRRSAIVNQILDGVAGPGVHVLDPASALTTRNGVSLMVKDGLSLYADTNHLSTYGAMQLEPLFSSIFDTIKQETNRSQKNK